MIESQKQSASENSVALQAKGDLTVNNYHGLSAREVSELVDIFMHHRLPAFQDEARKIAEKSATKFCEEFISQSGTRNALALTSEEFKQPDSQAIFNKALSGYAIKGDDVDVQLIVSALIQRLEATEKPLLKQALESAVELMPKLSRSQIAFLAFVQYTKSVVHSNATSLRDLEDLIAPVMKAIDPGLGLSYGNQQYLAGVGAITINAVADANNLMEGLHRKYAFLKEDMAQVPPIACPSFQSMVKHFGDMEIPIVFPTLAGSTIGLLFLQTVLGEFDLTIWIK